METTTTQPNEKLLSGLAKIRTAIEARIENYTSTCLSYQKAEKEIGVAYAMEWKTESRYRATYSRHELTCFSTFLDHNPEGAIEWLNYQIEGKTDNLLTGGFCYNSTSPMANLMNTWKSLEDADLIKLYKSFLKVLTA